MEREVTVIPITIGTLGTDIKWSMLWQENLKIRARVETIQTTEIGQNTEKSPRDIFVQLSQKVLFDTVVMIKQIIFKQSNSYK